MCGIAGFIDPSKATTQKTLESMTEALVYRGPDDSGIEFINRDRYSIGIGHRRLSIIDLSPQGHQPMTYGRYTVIFNGEIYNFREIKEDLEKLGYSFESHSDTEVILKSFDKWGPSCVNRFIGMFAFALYDSARDVLYLFRDRAGVKPLYYYKKNGLFLFSSEIKSLHRHPDFSKIIDVNSLSLYFLYGYIPAPYTIFENTWKVLPGYYYTIDCNKGGLTKYKYWDVLDSYNNPMHGINEEDALSELKNILVSAFEYRMVSDVPVGLFLSGGYDSSAVAAILQSARTEKIKTFTIGFHEEEFNEAQHAGKIAEYLGTDHTEYYCTQKESLEIIPELPDIFDEPFGDSSAIPTVLVSRLARKKVTVALSADAGDEIFAGYGKYKDTLRYYKTFSKIPSVLLRAFHTTMDYIDPGVIPVFNSKYNFRTRYFKIRDLLTARNITDAMSRISRYMTENDIKNYISETAPELYKTFFDDENQFSPGVDDINRMCAIDYKTYMVDDILVKVDRATMSVSLEGREPLLDHRIIEFIARLSGLFKLRNGETKYLFKKIVHNLIPRQLLERPKMGFGVPIGRWLKNELQGYLHEYLEPERLKREGILNSKSIARLKDSYLGGKPENAKVLWLLLVFEMWYERWMTSSG